MRNKDQILLENAYEQIVLKEDWRKTLATGALAAGMGLQGLQAKNKQTEYPQDMDGAGIESIQRPETSEQGAFETIIDQLSNLQVGNSTKEPPLDKELLIKVANSKNLEERKRVTDLIQFKGYRVPVFFGKYDKLQTPVGG